MLAEGEFIVEDLSWDMVLMDVLTFLIPTSLLVMVALAVFVMFCLCVSWNKGARKCDVGKCRADLVGLSYKKFTRSSASGSM